MRTAVCLSILFALTACEDDRRASHRDRDDVRSTRQRKMDEADEALRKIDDDLHQLQKQIAPSSTGAYECDELIRRSLCVYDQPGSGIPATARQMFEDGVQMWRDALANDATRQATIDACKMSLDAGKAGFDAAGCY